MIKKHSTKIAVSPKRASVKASLLKKICMGSLWLCFAFAVTLFSWPASAQTCSSPSGVEGEIIYKSTGNVPAYCDGINWIAMVGADPIPRGYTANGVRFNGTTGLTRAPLTGVADGGSATYSFWIKFNANDAWQRILSMRASANDHTNIARNNANQLYFSVRAPAYNPQFTITSPTTVTNGQWHHIMMSFNATTNTWHFYQDDQSAGIMWANPGPNISNIDYDFTDNWGIGIDPQNGWNPFSGEIADLWVDFGTYMDLSVQSNRRRFIDTHGRPVFLGADGSLPTGTAPDIFMSGDTATWHENKGTGGNFAVTSGALTTAPTSPAVTLAPGGARPTALVPSGLIGYWRLDETSGTLAQDSSGNGYSGTVSGTNFASSSFSGMVNTGLNFDGVNDTVDFGTQAALKPPLPITYAAWVYLPSLTLVGPLFANDSQNAYSGVWIQIDSSHIVAQIGDNTGSFPNNRRTKASVNAITKAGWNHIAVVWRGLTDMSIYVNGTDVGGVYSGTGAGLVYNVGNRAYIGRRHTNYFGGGIDDARLYNRALSANEIQQIFNAHDGIRYNANEKVLEYFDGTQHVSMTKKWAEVDKGPVYGGFPDLNCPNAGDPCDDGSIYVGITPDGNVPMYMTTAAHQTTGPYGGSAQMGNPRCDAGGTNSRCWTGAENTVALSALTPAQTVPRYCNGLTAHGHDDWYLPSRAEVFLMHQMHSSVGSDMINNEYYFSSSEALSDYVWTVNSATGHLWHEGSKGNALPARCVRKGVRGIARTGGLIGHWKLDETTGTSAADSSGNGRNGTMVSGLNAGTTGSYGAVGRSLKFDGSDDMIHIPDFLGAESAISMSAWVKAESWTGPFRFIAGQAKHTNSDSVVEFNYGHATNTMSWTVRNAGNVNVITNFTPPQAGVWFHITGTYDGSHSRIYLNGILQDTQAQTGVLFDSNAVFTIGRKSDSGVYPAGSHAYTFDGHIDDVRIYDRTLSAVDVQKLYQMGSPIGQNTALPLGCPNVGDICDDGTIYAGLSPDGNIPMFTTNGSIGRFFGNNGNTTGSVEAFVTGNTGAANTSILAALDSDSVTGGFQPHQAARACHNLHRHGANDWYLPSTSEAALYLPWAGDLVGAFRDAIRPAQPWEGYWNSSERNNGTEWELKRVSGVEWLSKNTLSDRDTICVRKGPAPRCLNPYGLEGEVIYNQDHDVVQFCDGARWIGVGKE